MQGGRRDAPEGCLLRCGEGRQALPGSQSSAHRLLSSAHSNGKASTTDTQVAAVLRAARTIVVLGAHEQPSKPAFYVPDYLHGQGYRIVPVNPQLAGKELWGERVRATLAEVGDEVGVVDIVDVFRRPEVLPTHLGDLLAMSPRPKLVWLQLGIRNDTFARAVEAAGIDVIQAGARSRITGGSGSGLFRRPRLDGMAWV